MLKDKCGRSLMVELVLAKDWVRVRFPAPAQIKTTSIKRGCFNLWSEKMLRAFSPGNRSLIEHFFEFLNEEKIQSGY